LIQIDVAKMRAEFQKGDATRDQGLSEPDTVEKIRDLSYGPHGIDNHFDIYYPTGTQHALPTLIHIHGGGFFYGDKELYRFYTMFLASQGYTVINFNYRLAPTNQYPAPLEDINNLMHWLVDHAADYYIDLSNLFLLGDSAGGQLTEQYTTMTTNPDYASLFNFTLAPVHFNAVGLNCGAYFLGKDKPIEASFPYYFGENPDATVKKGFPVEAYITTAFPPAFVMTASHDFLNTEGLEMGQFLIAKGIETHFKIYSNPDGSELGHVFHIDQKSAVAKNCNLDQLNFFQAHLK
jgi:acetyl esterase/lipase